MSEAQKVVESNDPLPSDGWKSRKVIIASASMLLMISLSFACMFVAKPGGSEPIATFDQVSSLWQIMVPSVLVPLFGALGLDKLAEAKRGA